MEDALKPTELKEAMGISLSYASMILNGRREPPVALALRIHSRFGVKLGCLTSASDNDIAALRRVHGGEVPLHAPGDTAAVADASANIRDSDIPSETDATGEADSHRPFCPPSSGTNRTLPSTAGQSPRPSSTGPTAVLADPHRKGAAA